MRDFYWTHAESEAMGSRLKIPDDGPPSVAEFAENNYDEDLPKLRIPNPWKDGRLPMILEGVKRLKELCGGRHSRCRIHPGFHGGRESISHNT